jgi:hypothetical protein
MRYEDVRDQNQRVCRDAKQLRSPLPDLFDQQNLKCVRAKDVRFDQAK